MNILESLINGQRANSVHQAGSGLGLDAGTTENLLRQLVPALTGGLQRNLVSSGGLASLAGALANGNHERYLDDPGALQSPAAVEDGNAILGHLFGSKDVSRDVADRAATKTGIDAGTIKKFLPIAAAAVMAALSKRTAKGSSLQSAGGGGLLSGLLDSGGDGIGVDDLLRMGKKLF
jgi:hypothetical protein